MKILIMAALTLCLTKAEEVALQEFTTASNLFTSAIYREVLKENQGNFIVSPFSIQTVLALTQSGAKADTASEIRTSLHLPNSSQETEALYSNLLPKFKGSSEYALHTANKIFIKDGLPLKEDFKKTATDVYQSGIESIDFSQKIEAADAINKWVEGKTEEKIHDLIDPNVLDAETKVILINALYFKGKWLNPFDVFVTHQADFYKSAKDIVKVDTMSNTDLYNYYESPELKAKFLEMPYQGGDVSMIVVLPNDKEGLSSLEGQIEKVFAAPNFSEERVTVSLPKFKIENKVQMKKILQNLGVKKAFTSDADLSGLAGKQGDLFISDVIQKAFINVTETGTEAAAATAACPCRLEEHLPTLIMAPTKAGEANLKQLTISNTLFTGDLYKEAVKQNAGNSVISPFSVQIVLALTQSGAKDDTASQIRTSLHLPGTSKETEDLYSQLLSSIKKVKQCVLKTANKMYVRNTYPLNDDFKKVATEVYRSEIENIDFTHAIDAADSINIWVEQQTNHKIKNLLDAKKIKKNTKVILINALYFKGRWVVPFDEADTDKRDFYKTAEDKIQVDTMMNNSCYHYCEHAKLNAKFLEMPYRALENQLDKVVSVSNFTDKRVYVVLPKFQIEAKFEMKSMLENLGIHKAFTQEADLSGIAGKKRDLFICDVIQKVCIDVSETGTETSISAARGGAPGFEDLKDFIADHPFLFFIKLKENNVLLFVGRYKGP